MSAMLGLRRAHSASVSSPKFLHFLPNPAFLLRFPAKLCSLSHSLPSFIHKADHDVALFIRMLHMRDTPPIFEFNKILEALVKKERYTTVIFLSQQLEFMGIIPDIFTYNLCINCYSHLGRIAPTFSVLGKILTRSYEPDTMTLNMLTKGLCLNGQVNEAKHVFSTMIQMGVTPDFLSYSNLIIGFCKIQMMNEAMNLLKEVQSKRIFPCQDYYHIDDLCQSGRISDALELVNEMRSRGIIISYSILVEVLCMSHHFDKAIALLRKIKDQGIEPEVEAYTRLIHELCKGGKIKDALEIFQGFLTEGCELTIVAYIIMVNGLCNEGFIEEAVALLSKMEDNGWIDVIHALRHNDNVKKLVHEMRARGLLHE